MAMTANDIVAHPALAACVRTQAEALISMQEASPRSAAPFARPQRWLMAQAILAAYFRNEAREAGSGLLSQHFVNMAVSHNLASRNTAAAFINEMRKYGVVSQVADGGGKRYRRLEPSQNMLAMSLQWLAVHLATLDGLDGGGRSAALRKQPARFGAIQPLVADGLLASRAIRRSTEKFSLPKWIDDGGIVMDRLITGCPQDTAGLERIPTDVMSVSGLARRLNLSRSQLSRKFAIVEAMGSLGWSGARGQSALWMSAEFWRAYHAAQAEKLSIIDAAVVALFEDSTPNRNLQIRVSQPVLSVAAASGRNF
jgi:AraC-like DNA-binding protein